MRIQWDAALVAALARELDARFRGARIRAVHLDPEGRRFTIYLREATWVWKLHPEERGFVQLPPDEPPPEARALPAKVRAIHAPPDERVLIIETLRVRGRPPRIDLILELMTNQENAIWTEGPERTVRLLLRTREGERPVRRGQPYRMPPPTGREGVEAPIPPERWAELVGGDDPDATRRRLLSSVAWMSRPLAEAITEAASIEAGRALWLSVRAAVTGEVPPGRAALLLGRSGPQPWPVGLPDRTVEETTDLLDAFDRLAGRDDAITVLLPTALLDRLDGWVERLRGRVAALESEASAPDTEPAELRARGDLLLARFHEVPRGVSQVTLTDFEGGEIEIGLDPTLPPGANARALYDRAARLERARERLPELIAEARRRWEAGESLQARARAGEATREEIESALPADAGRGKGGDGPILPYRVYRASSGREIRVGRGSSKNDDLTFHHSAPNDVWLHARHVAGAHVILRWGRDETPPPQDLREAGGLAALHSKARTSGSVPVDWTFRKYVRKPRKAPAGAVVPDRVKTVFVEPDPDLETRLRGE